MLRCQNFCLCAEMRAWCPKVHMDAQSVPKYQNAYLCAKMPAQVPKCRVLKLVARHQNVNPCAQTRQNAHPHAERAQMPPKRYKNKIGS